MDGLTVHGLPVCGAFVVAERVEQRFAEGGGGGEPRCGGVSVWWWGGVFAAVGGAVFFTFGGGSAVSVSGSVIGVVAMAFSGGVFEAEF